MKIETTRLKSITDTISNLLTDSQYELRVGWDGSLESPFMNSYRHYSGFTERWRDENILVLDPYSLESEIRDNFLQVDDNGRSNYNRLLTHKVSTLNAELKSIIESVAKLKIGIKNGTVNRDESIEYDYRDGGTTVSSFIYAIDHVISMAGRVESIINDNIQIFYPSQNQSATEEPIGALEPTASNSTIQWKGNKTDLAELIWVLFKSGRISDSNTGESITQVELTRQFETMFGQKLDVVGLMKGRMKTYKATSDGSTFTKTLFDLINDRLANS